MVKLYIGSYLCETDQTNTFSPSRIFGRATERHELDEDVADVVSARNRKRPRHSRDEPSGSSRENPGASQQHAVADLPTVVDAEAWGRLKTWSGKAKQRKTVAMADGLYALVAQSSLSVDANSTLTDATLTPVPKETFRPSQNVAASQGDGAAGTPSRAGPRSDGEGDRPCLVYYPLEADCIQLGRAHGPARGTEVNASLETEAPQRGEGNAEPDILRFVAVNASEQHPDRILAEPHYSQLRHRAPKASFMQRYAELLRRAGLAWGKREVTDVPIDAEDESIGRTSIGTFSALRTLTRSEQGQEVWRQLNDAWRETLSEEERMFFDAVWYSERSQSRPQGP
jgi:hypothetical protein